MDPSQIALIPGQIARRLRGLPFRNFREFRQTFWRMVADDTTLNMGWSQQNLRRMQQGKPPFAPQSEKVGRGSNAVYQLDHVQALANQGGVYDLDNIHIVSPKMHVRVGER